MIVYLNIIPYIPTFIHFPILQYILYCTCMAWKFSGGIWFKPYFLVNHTKFKYNQKKQALNYLFTFSPSDFSKCRLSYLLELIYLTLSVIQYNTDEGSTHPYTHIFHVTSGKNILYVCAYEQRRRSFPYEEVHKWKEANQTSSSDSLFKSSLKIHIFRVLFGQALPIWERTDPM